VAVKTTFPTKNGEEKLPDEVSKELKNNHASSIRATSRHNLWQKKMWQGY
jgi:hypothetical protein